MKWHGPSRARAVWIALFSTLCGISRIGATPADPGKAVIHGPPTLVSDATGPVVLSYAANPSTGADLHAWRLLAPPGEGEETPRELSVCSARGDQLDPAAVPDGSGGLLVVWEDFRSGHDLDLYAQHLLASGAIDPTWPHDGAAVCRASGAQMQPQIVSDGEGGALVVWRDRRSGADDVFLQHLRSDGTTDPAWPDGRSIASGARVRTNPAVMPDGSAGVIVAWQQPRDGSGADIVARQFLPDGLPGVGWPEQGRVVGGASGDPVDPVIVSDGAGGCIVAWTDLSRPEATRLFAQRILSSGERDPRWAEAGNALSAAKGSQRQPSLVADGSGGAFVAWQEGNAESGESRVLVDHLTDAGTMDSAWPEKGLLASTAKGVQVTPRLARTGNALAVAWLDRKDPGAVRAYAQRVLLEGKLDPSWSAEGSALSADPADDLVLATSGPDAAHAAWRDPGAWQVHSIRLGATPPELANAGRVRTEMLAPRPNPASSAVTFRFTLATRQRARLAVFDIQGRRVAAPIDRTLDPGPHDVAWNRRDAHGGLAPNGVYFVRFDAEGIRSSKRFVLTR